MATVATATVAMVAMVAIVAMVVMAATKKARLELRAVHTATATWFMAAKYPCTQPPIKHANPNESRAMHTNDKHQSTSHDTQTLDSPARSPHASHDRSRPAVPRRARRG